MNRSLVEDLGLEHQPMPSLRLLVGLVLWAGVLAALARPLAAQQDTTRQGTVRLREGPPLRDPIGDLNAAAVRAGTFDGAILLPGTKVSLAIGGFVKTAVIADSRLEVSGADLLPTSFGTTRADEDGNFSVDATLSKLFLDARAPARSGSVRGYIEWDFNASNNGALGLRPRLIFGAWQTKHGTLLAGQHWATFMNVGIIPEGLTEPTVSGAVFARQAQVRWTQRISEPLSLAVALENPGSGDFLFQNESVARTRWPDLVAAAEWQSPSVGQLRASGLVRRIADGADSSLSPATGWGVSVGGYLRIAARDRFTLSGTYGRGIARYVLGLGAGASGVVDAGEFQLLHNSGVLGVYRHGWSEHVRTSVALGRAWTNSLDAQPTDAFKNSTYGFANLMWSAMPYITYGIEYAYGRMEQRNGSSHDNHRVAIGVQIF